MKKLILSTIILILSFGSISCTHNFSKLFQFNQPKNAEEKGEQTNIVKLIKEWSKPELEKALVIMTVPRSVKPQQLKVALHDALDFPIIVSMKEHEGKLISSRKLSRRPPLKEALKSLFGTMLPKVNISGLTDKNAYYIVEGIIFNDQLEMVEYYVGGIYPYRKGYVVYIYILHIANGGILTGVKRKLFETLTKLTTNLDDYRLSMAAYFRDEFIERVPQAKILAQYPKTLYKVITVETLGGLSRRVFFKEK